MGTVWTAEDLENLESNDLAPVIGKVDDDPDPGDTTDADNSVTETAKEPEATPEFRYGDDAPEDLRGKTASEAAAFYTAQQTVAKSLIDQMRRSVPVAPAAPLANPDDFRLTEEDLLGTDPATVNAKINRMQDAKIQPLVQDYHQQQSINVYTRERTNPTKPYFQKYEQEIIALASQLPVNQTSNPATWDLLYKHVIASHLDEIVNEKVAASSASAAPQRQAPQSERGNNRSAVTIAEPKGALTKDEQRIARSLGVSDEEYLKYKPKD